MDKLELQETIRNAVLKGMKEKPKQTCPQVEAEKYIKLMIERCQKNRKENK